VPKPSQFVQHVVEILREFGVVEAKPMFGGWGLYRDDVFFALIADDTLYLKTDADSRPAFDERGLEPFAFSKKGETIVTSYRRAPEEALESPGAMAEWARRGYAAALKAAARRPARRPLRKARAPGA
jgi:DNA transformation protein